MLPFCSRISTKLSTIVSLHTVNVEVIFNKFSKCESVNDSNVIFYTFLGGVIFESESCPSLNLHFLTSNSPTPQSIPNLKIFPSRLHYKGRSFKQTVRFVPQNPHNIMSVIVFMEFQFPFVFENAAFDKKTDRKHQHLFYTNC